MGRPDIKGMVGIVLGAEGIVAAELAALKGLVQITDDPLAGPNQAAQGAFRSGTAGEQQDAIANLAVGVDALADRARAIAALQCHFRDQQMAEAMQQQVGGSGEGELDIVQPA